MSDVRTTVMSRSFFNMTTPGRASARELIAKHYRDAIRDGRLKPGEEMPRIVDLAEEWEISKSTAHRVLLTLQQEGLIVSRPSKTAVVAERPER